ncbi:MAG: phosphonate ABC transporter ATP-binding protein [Deinococcales bacterium]
MIEVKNLSKVFPDGTKALDNVTLNIPDGQFVCVIGLSGAGKSTFMRCLNRLNDPTAGTIMLEGQDIAFAQGRELRKLRRRIGFVFQQFNLVERLSAIENVLSGRLGYYGRLPGVLGLFSPQDKQLAIQALKRVGLEEKIYTTASNLSGGQKQRVAIARALVQQPKLMLADEPTASIDPKLSGVIMDLLKSFTKDGITVIVNIHVLELAREYAERILGFNKGKLIFDGTPAQLTDAEVDRIYAGSVADL